MSKASETTGAAEKKAVPETEELVEVTVSRLPGSAANPDKYVSINGKSWLIPRGVPTKVPKIVAEELIRAARAESHMYAAQDEMESASQQ